jgi:UDP-N-acetylmuramoylalanine--D-glutamate ligase
VINLSVLQGSSYIVLGLARSGLSTVRALMAAGIECAAWDDSPETRAAAASAGVKLAEPEKIDWSKITALVISPGIPNLLPQPHAIAAAARAAGKPLICDIDLLAQAEPKARYVAITGTNGKSTTTALIGHILESAGWPSQMGGNIGKPVLDLEPLGLGGVYVLEMSSYQLELVQTFHANVAVWLNITPDHLDRHGDMAGYVAAKQHIFDRQATRDCAIIGIDDKYSVDIFRWLTKRRLAEDIAVVPMALKRTIAGGVNFEAGRLVDGEGYKVQFADVPTLPGDHNAQNAAAAWAAVRWIGVPREKAAAGLRSYPGLPHRQERVAAVASALVALLSFTSTGSWAVRPKKAAWCRSRRTSSACARRS